MVFMKKKYVIFAVFNNNKSILSMKVIEMCKTNSIMSQFLSELRSVDIQRDSMRFRRNLERIGETMAYEVSKTLCYENVEIDTPLGVSTMMLPLEFPVIASILRAGLPMHNGILNIFDKSENAFISAYRKYHKNGEFNIELEYISSPDLTDRTLIIADPMLATGASMVMTYKSLLEFGKPLHTHFISIIGSVEGVEYVKKNIGAEKVTLWVVSIDDALTAQAYIVPGLGDAGDLAYGKKN